MKEVKSQSRFVGKVITCNKCNRSYEIEAGDVTPGRTLKIVSCTFLGRISMVLFSSLLGPTS